MKTPKKSIFDMMIQFKFLVLFTILSLSSVLLNGQSSVTTLREAPLSVSYSVETWNTENGLPQNTVSRVVQTHDNYIWIATNDGLARFDGVKFTVYNLLNTPQLRANRIVDLYVDRNGALWIATENCKISVYRNGQFFEIPENSLIKNYISNFAEDRDGNVWVASNDILIKFSDYKIAFTRKLNLRNDNMRRFMVWDNDRLYIGGSCLYLYMHGAVTAIPLFQNKLVQRLIKTKQGEILIGTWDGIYQAVKDGFKLITYNNCNTDNLLSGILEDTEGKLWILRRHPQVTILSHGTFSVFPTDALPQDYALNIMQDHEGNIWLGTFTSGLIRLKKNVFTTFNQGLGAGSKLTYPILQAHDGSFYVGTNGGGLKRIQGGKVEQFEDKQFLTNQIGVWALCEDSKGNIWSGTYGAGVQKITGHQIIPQQSKEWLPAKVTFAILEDKHKNLWFGCMNGALKYADGEITHYTTREGLANNEVRCIYEDKDGAIWFGTYGGVSCFKNGKFTSYTTGQGLSCDFVRAILKDENGNVWIGTYGGGLNRLRDGHIVQLTTKDGLFDNNVSTIIEDGYGFYWMTCNKGIYKVAKKELNEFADGRSNYIHCVAYNKSDGLESNECNGGCQPSSWRSKDGKLYFPTMAGVAVIDPSLLKNTNRTINPLIESVRIDEKPSVQSDTIIVGPDYEKIEIDFNAITFRNPGNIRFKYLIEGLFSNWSTATEHHSAIFSKIPPGVYKFKVVNCDESGIWSNNPAVITLIIKAHFYQTAWFYLLVVILLVGLMVCGFLYRIKYLNRQTTILNDLVEEKTSRLAGEKIKTEEAYYQMSEAKEAADQEKEKAQQANFEKTELINILTHDLKNPLNCISGGTTLISESPEDTEMVTEIIQLIDLSAKNMTNMLRQLHEHIQLENFYLKLSLRKTSIRDLVKSVVEKNQIQATLKNQHILFDPVLEQGLLLEIDENKMYSAFDNLVSNAVKYSPLGKSIFISLSQEDTAIRFAIRDEGPGLTDQDKKLIFGKFQRLSAKPTGDEISTGLGLSIVKRIVELHHGTIRVQSEYGYGSVFIVELPLVN